ncbi:hypothetical protein QLQ12_20010 [Actinoplanes sp. NEAU-A12]|uniref:Uncharacterized protein n=1 Tax=Actinoplanes sandaracinus TaxID=3045177 RepID=A0ABT6WMF4_9ACTN|nr:hypothetical protein [Actinoplanes sandaracinus]MDI6100902.1 hypothetical protein [Actinoplanes sandaracinus]
MVEGPTPSLGLSPLSRVCLDELLQEMHRNSLSDFTGTLVTWRVPLQDLRPLTAAAPRGTVRE